MLRPTLTGPAAVPPNLVASISPATTSQSTPGAVVLTASATGGTGAQTWAWAATYADGTSAAALLSGSGSSVTLTTTAYYTAVRVVATATDAAGQTSSASALVEVGAPAALVSGGNLTATQLNAGTTSQAFTFTAPTGGVTPITNALTVESSTGAVTLSTSSGLSATLQGLTDGTTVQVTMTSTDALGQVVTATGVYGVAVAPVFDESAQWNVIADIDLTAQGTGSATGDGGTFTVGGRTYTIAKNGTPTTLAASIGASGLTVSQGSTTGTTAVWFDPGILDNWESSEDIVIDVVLQAPASMTASGGVVVGVGDSATYISGDAYSCTLGQTGISSAKRTSASTQTNYTLTSQSANYWNSKTVAFQLFLGSGRIFVGSLAEQSDYIDPPLKGRVQPMQGTYTICAGSAAVAGGTESIPQTLSAMRVQLAVSVNNTAGTYLRKIRFSRMTRPSA